MSYVDVPSGLSVTQSRAQMKMRSSAPATDSISSGVRMRPRLSLLKRAARGVEGLDMRFSMAARSKVLHRNLTTHGSTCNTKNATQGISMKMWTLSWLRSSCIHRVGPDGNSLTHIRKWGPTAANPMDLGA